MKQPERRSYRRNWDELQNSYSALEKAYDLVPAPAVITAANSDGMFGFADLVLALQVRCYVAGKDDPFARKLLARARATSEALLAADLFERPPAEYLFPLNRGRAKRTKAYADALLGDAPLDRRLCRETAADLAEYARRVPEDMWDGHEQSRQQDAIETLLLAGEQDEASALIARARPMSGNWVKERFAFAQRFAAACAYPLRDEALRYAYLGIFDAMRNPRLPEAVMRSAFPVNSLHHLTLAALYLKYFESGDGSFTWGRALELMSE